MFETSIFNINRDGLPGPLIIGTVEKRVPGPLDGTFFEPCQKSFLHMYMYMIFLITFTVILKIPKALFLL